MLSPEEQPWSGAGADARDPAMLGASLDDLVREQHWEKTVASAGLAARWEQIVGADLAAHCRPERLEGDTLTCVAESTAWATQIRMLSATILTRLATEVGIAAADCLAQAVLGGVLAAESIAGIPSYRDVLPGAFGR